MTGKEMMAREERLLADLIAERDSLRKQVEALTKQRTWVGLTEEDREQHRDDWHSNIHDKEFRAIEAKLKEKNT